MVFRLEGQNKDTPRIEDKRMGDRHGNQNHLDSGYRGVVRSESSQNMARSVRTPQDHTARHSSAQEEIHPERKRHKGMPSSDLEAGADTRYCNQTR